MADKVRVVPQEGGFRDATFQDVKNVYQRGTTRPPPDGFNGDTLGVSDGGMFPWQQKRSFDPTAYNVQNLDQRVAQNQERAAQYDARGAPVAGQTRIDTGNENQARGQQYSLAQTLAAQANGQGPSLAQMQLQKATDANIHQAMALGASQRGVGAAGVMRSVANNTAMAQQQAAADSAALRLQEQQASQNQLGQLLAGMRGQDQSIAGSQAQLNQQVALANQQAQLGMTGLNDAQNRYYAQAGTDLYSQQMAARQAREDEAIRYEGMLRGVAVEGQKTGTQVAGAGLAALGGLAALSDETKKTNIEDGGKELDKFLGALSSNKYEYKDKKHGPGTYWSPMAQDLEKTEVGKSMVVETPEGKVVDYARGLGAYLAGLSHVHKRLARIEGAARG